MTDLEPNPTAARCLQRLGFGGAMARAMRSLLTAALAVGTLLGCGDDAAPVDAGRLDADMRDGATLSRAVTLSNVGDRIAFDRGSADVHLEFDDYPYWVFDTDTGAITAYDDRDIFVAYSRVVREAGFEGDDSGIDHLAMVIADGVGVGVFSMASLHIDQGAVLVGVGSRGLVIVADGVVEVEGELTVGANFLPTRYPGPGGHPGAPAGRVAGLGPGGGRAATSADGGGGGGSFGGLGGVGGAPEEESAAGGTSYGSLELVPLVGGSGGGGASDPSRGGRGGGGGAVQVSAAERIIVGVTGTIDACGAGGVRSWGSNGGGGGGSGGAILLEAPSVEMLGVLGANGGAGAQGVYNDGGGASGSRGSAGLAPVLGAITEGNAAAGGNGSDPLGVGGDAPIANYGGGGGGGGGRIRINTAAGTELYAGALPTAASGLLTVGRLPSAEDP